MASSDNNRYDDSEEEEDFNPAPADLSDDEGDHDTSNKHARDSSPVAADDDDDAPAPSKSRLADDDEDEDQDDEEVAQHDEDEDEDDEDDEDEDDVQQVSLPACAAHLHTPRGCSRHLSALAHQSTIMTLPMGDRY